MIAKAKRQIKCLNVLLFAALIIFISVITEVYAGQNEEIIAAHKSGDYDKAFTLAKPLALQGDAQAQYALGVMYSSGQGVRQNDAEATKWYRKSAEQGFSKAQYNLGNMYHQGKGVSQNDNEAVKWYRKAAEQGFALAQFNLGNMYARGAGVDQDKDEAVKWYKRAAEQGDKDALEMLNRLNTNTVTKNNIQTKAVDQKKCTDLLSFAGISWTDTPQDVGKKFIKAVNAPPFWNRMNDPKGAFMHFDNHPPYKYSDINAQYDQACGSVLLHLMIDPDELRKGYVKDAEFFFTKSKKLLYYVIYFWSQYNENVYDSMVSKYGTEKERSNGWAVWDCGSERLYLQLSRGDSVYSRKAIYINVSDINGEIQKCNIAAEKRDQQIKNSSRKLF
mgnify:CR=1 FL=1